MKLPPPLTGASLGQLRAALDRISRFVDSFVREYAEELVCGQGCDGCCRQVLSLRGIEAAHLLAGARALAPQAISLVWSALASGGPEGPCPLLQGGNCLTYEHRPAICRTHGLPMIRREGGRAVLHHCAENFQTLDPSRIPPAMLLDEERLTLLVDALDAYYCRQTGWTGERIAVDELLRSGLQP